jgi:hypothetical protein
MINLGIDRIGLVNDISRRIKDVGGKIILIGNINDSTF